MSIRFLIACLALAGCDRTPSTPSAAPSAAKTQAATVPADVIAFIATRDQCDHLRGEEGYDEARQRFLAERLAATCTGTDAALAMLRKRYADKADVIAKLKGYEASIE